MTLLCAPNRQLQYCAAAASLVPSTGWMCLNGVASGHRRLQIQTPLMTAKPPHTGVRHVPRTPRLCAHRQFCRYKGPRYTPCYLAIKGLGRPYCAGTTLARGALGRRLVCSLASCSGTVAVLAGLVALRSAQTHDPSWDPPPHFGVTAGASRLSLAAHWAGCRAIAVDYYGGALHNGHHFSRRGCSYKVTVAASPPKIYFRLGLYHLSSLPVLPATAAGKTTHTAHPLRSSPSQTAEPQMTERSVSQQVSTDMAAASSNNVPFRNNPSCSPPTSWSARSAGGLLHLIKVSTGPLPCQSVCLAVDARQGARETGRMGELTLNFAHFQC